MVSTVRAALILGLSVGLYHTAVAQIETELLPEASQDEALQERYTQLLEEQLWENIGPIRLNTASAEELLALPGSSTATIQAILLHRQRYGDFLHLHELLQCGIDTGTIRKWERLVRIESGIARPNLNEAIQSQILLRWRSQIEPSEGYAAERKQTNSSHYAGKPWHSLLRIGIKGNRLQAGLVAERDAGDVFTHLSWSARWQTGPLQLVLGDIRLGWGYGLLLNNGFYAGMSADPLLAMPTTASLRMGVSAAEMHRLRGVALNYRIGAHQTIELLLARSRQHAAIAQQEGEADVVERLELSGYFRTPTEQERWRRLGESSVGIAWKYRKRTTELGVHSLYQRWDKSFRRGERPDQLFDFSGNHQLLAGMYFRKTWGATSLLGEAVVAKNGSVAKLLGLQLPLAAGTGLHLMYRHYPQTYFAPLAQTIAQSNSLQGETGFTSSWWWDVNRKLRITALSDYFRRSWLSFSSDRPGDGHETQLQLAFTPRRGQQFQIRYRNRRVERNQSERQGLQEQRQQQLRLSVRLAVNDQLTLNSGCQLQRLNRENSQGFGLWVGVRYQGERSKIRIAAQHSLFQGEEDALPLYVQEADLPFNANMAVLSGLVARSSLLVVRKFGHFEMGVRWARGRQFDRAMAGSGLDRVNAPYRSEIKIQLRYQW